MYAEQLEFAVRLQTALSYILDQIDQHPSEYPDLKKVLELCGEGCQRNIHTPCDDAPEGECIIITQAGGLVEIIGLLEDAIGVLTMEVDYEGDEPCVSEGEETEDL